MITAYVDFEAKGISIGQAMGHDLLYIKKITYNSKFLKNIGLAQYSCSIICISEE